MRDESFSIQSQTLIAERTYECALEGDTREITRPGQFVNLRLDGFFLRRPISVSDVNGNTLRLVYKVVGEGTRALSRLAPGTPLSVLTGLGNGYDTNVSKDRPLLIGGGTGVAPLYYLARTLLGEGKRVTLIAGFNAKREIYDIKALEQLGVRVRVTTVDGSVGTKGFVTDALPEEGSYTYVYACGPLPMLKAVYDHTTENGQYSFEERMGCGFGACMGCGVETKNGMKRVCKDGPVFYKEEILWRTPASR